LPNSLSAGVFTHIGRTVREILADFSEGKKPYDETLLVVDALMKYQENLKKLIGFETEVELEDIIPFPPEVIKVIEVSKSKK
jgi:hypothetical protein